MTKVFFFGKCNWKCIFSVFFFTVTLYLKVIFAKLNLSTWCSDLGGVHNQICFWKVACLSIYLENHQFSSCIF